MMKRGIKRDKVREMRIQENQLKLKELGVRSMAYDLQLRKGSKKTDKTRMQSKRVAEDIEEYMPCVEETTMGDDNVVEVAKSSLNLRSRSKKVVSKTTLLCYLV